MDSISKYIEVLPQPDANFSLNIDSCSAKVEFLNSDDMLIPIVFTPNNDEMNDVFLVKSDMMHCVIGRLQIFNRWGQQIYDSKTNNDLLEWDGCHNGKLVSPGVYVFVLSGNLKKKLLL